MVWKFAAWQVAATLITMAPIAAAINVATTCPAVKFSDPVGHIQRAESHLVAHGAAYRAKILMAGGAKPSWYWDP